MALLDTSLLAVNMGNLVYFQNVFLAQNRLYLGLVDVLRKVSPLIFLLIDVVKWPTTWNYLKPDKKATKLLKLRVSVFLTHPVLWD